MMSLWLFNIVMGTFMLVSDLGPWLYPDTPRELFFYGWAWAMSMGLGLGCLVLIRSRSH